MSRFKLVVRPALALVPAKLEKNWHAECVKFFDIDDSQLNLKVYMRHKNTTLDEKIGMPQRKKMMTPRGIQLTTNASRYLIITSPTNNKNSVLYYLSTYEKGFITMSRKKKREFCSKSIVDDMLGQLF